MKYRLHNRHHSTVALVIHVERKYLFYMMNLVIPCALIACMIFLVFLLPPKSGERISLGITVLLSMAIFQELSSEKLPSSSDTFPLLGTFFNFQPTGISLQKLRIMLLDITGLSDCVTVFCDFSAIFGMLHDFFKLLLRIFKIC